MHLQYYPVSSSRLLEMGRSGRGEITIIFIYSGDGVVEVCSYVDMLQKYALLVPSEKFIFIRELSIDNL